MQRTIALPAWMGLTVMTVVCGFALWKGGRAERIAAAGFVIGVLAGFALRDRHWLGTQWGVFAIDVAYLALLLLIALKSDRFWPLWAAGFQLLAVVTHAASIVDRTLAAWAYVTAGVIWTYLILGAIAWGAWSAWRNRGRAQPALAAAPITEPGATRR